MKKDYKDREVQKELLEKDDIFYIVSDTHEELLEDGYILTDCQVVEIMDYLTIHDFLINEEKFEKVVFDRNGHAYAKK